MFFVHPLKGKQVGLHVGTDLPLEEEKKGQRERDEYEAKECRETLTVGETGNLLLGRFPSCAYRLSHKGRLEAR